MAKKRSRKKKPPIKFPRAMQKKLLVMFGIIALMLVGLVVRLMYIERTSGERYEKIVLSQQEYDSQIIPYQRGDILDSKGTVLATSIAVYNVILDCYVMTSKDTYIEPTIQALTSCFPELTSEQLYTYARENADSRYIVLKKKASYEEIQPFVNMQEAVDEDDNLVNPNIKGVWFEKEYQREYPYGSLASGVIGFTTSGNVGINGLENYYDDTLNGVNGREHGYLNQDNDFEKTIKPAKNGSNIVTTIDANIQSIVEEKIKEWNDAYKNTYRSGEEGASHISVLIMDPNNGDVLAMASYPDYDLNNPRDLSAYYTEEAIDAMEDDEKLDILNKLWQNFCVTYTYEPGSTAKPFTIAAGLETGTLYDGETFYCDGYEMFPGDVRVRCTAFSRGGHGVETLEKALMDSCNDALMQMSYAIGIENFVNYQQIFGFGQKTNIDLPGETRTASLVYTQDTMTKLSLATNSFGQNFNCTMIQLASAYCSLVNGGHLYQPRLVKRITDENGNTIEEITPTLLRETVSESTSELLKGYLKAVVSEGTAKTAKVDGYSMGGKTGTAQKMDENGKRDDVNYLVSFIGFAPVEKPELVIYCLVDEPNAEEQAHSTFAQNITREILEEVLPYMNVYRDEEPTGINAGLDVTGNAVNAPAMTDIVNGDITGNLSTDEGAFTVPATMTPEGGSTGGDAAGDNTGGDAAGDNAGGDAAGDNAGGDAAAQ
ncbi:MAG: peptidoglycan D,D-transpeptidase FtsI family protein [Roseburia sp.]